MTVGLGSSGSGGEIVLSAGASSFAAGVDVLITSRSSTTTAASTGSILSSFPPLLLS